MKTGRVRKKKKASPKPATKPSTKKSKPSKARSRSAAAVRRTLSGSRPNPASPKLLAALFFGAFGILVLVMILITALWDKKADAWVPVTQTRGQWTTTVKTWGPQASREERWEADCRSDPQATVEPRTCILKDTEEYEDQVVDDYEEYAYNIHYEEVLDFGQSVMLRPALG